MPARQSCGHFFVCHFTGPNWSKISGVDLITGAIVLLVSMDQGISMEQSPLFILGAPRSGTTYLASLLKQSRFGAPFETHFVVKYYLRLSRYGKLNEFANFESLLKDIFKERAVQQWRLDFDPRAWFEELGEELGEDFGYAAIAEKVCRLAARKQGAECWGDKTPGYLTQLQHIDRLYPKARYIYIVRDGRDVAQSLLQKDWGPNNLMVCADYWKDYNRDDSRLITLAEQGRLYSIRYEDLLADVETHTEEIYRFLGETFDAEALQSVMGEAKSDNCYKWKSTLTERQVQLFERTAGDTLRRFGYEATQKEQGLSIGLSGYWRLHDFMCRMKFLFTTNVIDGVKIRFFGKEPFAS